MKLGEINSLFRNLSKVIKNPRSDLKYKNKFTLLVSVVLSAQCTDVNVNNVTKNIYPKYNRPEHFTARFIHRVFNTYILEFFFYL